MKDSPPEDIELVEKELDYLLNHCKGDDEGNFASITMKHS